MAVPLCLVADGHWMLVLAALSAGLLAGVLPSILRWWQRDPVAERLEEERIVLRRLRGLPDRD